MNKKIILYAIGILLILDVAVLVYGFKDVHVLTEEEKAKLIPLDEAPLVHTLLGIQFMYAGFASVTLWNWHKGQLDS